MVACIKWVAMKMDTVDTRVVAASWAFADKLGVEYGTERKQRQGRV